jgi:predicted transcriptional regulator
MNLAYSSFERRASYDICAALLRILLEDSGISQTRLALETNLDTRGIARYMDMLIRNHLVSRQEVASNNRPFIQITDKGRLFLEQYNHLMLMLE